MAIEYSLAPLAGFTDPPFRLICREYGADLTYTEMVSAAGLRHGNGPTRQLMAKMSGETNVACQIFGSDEEDVACAARVADPMGFAELNLNAGCPMKKVTTTGSGAKLVEDPAKIAKLVTAMRENTSLPVTLKTRLGPHKGETRIFEILDAAEQAGISKLIVHARYTSQMHGGEVGLDTLAEVVEKAKVPVVGNGSVNNLSAAKSMEKTGVSGIMIGRAALAAPWIFSILKGGEKPRTSPAEMCEKHLEYILSFREEMLRDWPGARLPGADGYAAIKMHTHLFRYFNGMPGAAKIRARLNSIRTIAEIRDIIQGMALQGAR